MPQGPHWLLLLGWIAGINSCFGKNSFAAQKIMHKKLIYKNVAKKPGTVGATLTREPQAIPRPRALMERQGPLTALEIPEPFPHDPQRCTNLRHCTARWRRVDSVTQQ